jgi:3-isopropylmalate dehydratase small subunit
VEELLADADEGNSLDVDLDSKTIFRQKTSSSISFEVDDFRRHCLLNGIDDIGLTLQKSQKISEFELKRSLSEPWFDNAAQLLVKL